MADDENRTLDADGVPADEENGLTLDDDESLQLQEVFSVIFPQYLIPLEELIGQVTEGEASEELCNALLAAVQPLAKAAASVGAKQIDRDLKDFQVAIQAFAADPDGDELRRDRVIEVFYRLKETVQNLGGGNDDGADAQPQGTRAAAQTTKPRGDFVARLKAIDGVEPADVQRLLAAGITSAQHITQGRVDELVAVTGLDEQLVLRIRQAFAGSSGSSGGSGDPSGSGDSSTTSRPSEGESQTPAEPAVEELEARLALLSAVREHLRLRHVLRREQKVSQAHAAEQTDLTRAIHLLQNRIRLAREAFDDEKQLAERCGDELAALKQETQATRAATLRLAKPHGEHEFQDLHRRIDSIKRRVANRMR